MTVCAVGWDATWCSQVELYRRFGGNYRLYFQTALFLVNAMTTSNFK